VSRYKIDIDLGSPEIFVGHHRVSALLALGVNKAKVVIAEDEKPGYCKSSFFLDIMYKKYYLTAE
jgi:hypothetical protein